MFVYQEPNKHAGVIGFINNLLGGVAQRQAEQQDMELINQIRSGGAITKLPSTPEMRKFALDLMNPKTQAEVENLMAEAGLFKARKRTEGMPQQLSPSEQRQQMLNQYIASKSPEEQEKIKQRLVMGDTTPSKLIGEEMEQARASGDMKRFDELAKIQSQSINIDNRPMTEGQIQRRVNRETLVNTANKIRENWKPEYTGPIDSKIQYIKTHLWGDRANAKWAAGVASLLQTMYDRAGKQLSDREIEKWKPFIPKETMPDESFQGQVDNLVENVADYLTNEEAVLRQAGYQTGQKVKTNAGEVSQEDANAAIDMAIQKLGPNATQEQVSKLAQEYLKLKSASSAIMSR